MDIFAFVILEETLDKMAELQIAPDRHSRLDQCVTVIRAGMDLIALDPGNRDYTDKIRRPIQELAGIARQSGDLMAARRLKMIAYQLGSASDTKRHLVQTA